MAGMQGVGAELQASPDMGADRLTARVQSGHRVMRVAAREIREGDALLYTAGYGCSGDVVRTRYFAGGIVCETRSGTWHVREDVSPLIVRDMFAEIDAEARTYDAEGHGTWVVTDDLRAARAVGSFFRRAAEIVTEQREGSDVQCASCGAHGAPDAFPEGRCGCGGKVHPFAGSVA